MARVGLDPFPPALGNAIGADYDVSRQYVYSWIHAGGPDREAVWHEAKKRSAHALIDESLEILDAPAEGITSAEVQLRRGRADFRKWLASVRAREAYGDQPPQVNVGVDLGQMMLEELRKYGGVEPVEEPELIEAEVVDDM